MTSLPDQSWGTWWLLLDISRSLYPKLHRQFLGWKNAKIPQLIDSDGWALHKDSESGPNSKITKITTMTFLQNPAELFFVKFDFLVTRCVQYQRFSKTNMNYIRAFIHHSFQVSTVNSPNRTSLTGTWGTPPSKISSTRIPSCVELPTNQPDGTSMGQSHRRPNTSTRWSPHRRGTPAPVR